MEFSDFWGPSVSAKNEIESMKNLERALENSLTFVDLEQLVNTGWLVVKVVKMQQHSLVGMVKVANFEPLISTRCLVVW